MVLTLENIRNKIEIIKKILANMDSFIDSLRLGQVNNINE